MPRNAKRSAPSRSRDELLDERPGDLRAELDLQRARQQRHGRGSDRRGRDGLPGRAPPRRPSPPPRGSPAIRATRTSSVRPVRAGDRRAGRSRPRSRSGAVRRVAIRSGKIAAGVSDEQRHQPLAAERRQRAAVGERGVGHVAARQPVERSLGDRHAEVVLDPEQEIEQVHRAEREVVEQQLLGSDHAVGRQRLRRADQRRDLLERACVRRRRHVFATGGGAKISAAFCPPIPNEQESTGPGATVARGADDVVQRAVVVRLPQVGRRRDDAGAAR